MEFSEHGAGAPLLLVHGLGGNRGSWDTLVPLLGAQRRLIIIDLPGHGATPAEADSGTFAGLVRSVQQFIAERGLAGVDVVGSSLGGRIALDLARQGGVGAVVALDPGGFWQGWERGFFRTTIAASVRLLRLMRPALPAVLGNPAGRLLLLAQLSAHPARLDGKQVAAELTSYATTPTFDALVRDLSGGPSQQGPAAADSGPVAIGWGRHDRLCLPRQAARAMARFPGAKLHWFEHSGHFPGWDEPAAAAEFILRSTGAAD